MFLPPPSFDTLGIEEILPMLLTRLLYWVPYEEKVEMQNQEAESQQLDWDSMVHRGISLVE
jgi:hypothetical protein